MSIKKYNRTQAVEYAQEWALKRNSKFHDYENYGGDCTNYISQCLHFGNIPYDYNGKSEIYKWYWNSDNSRTPSWTSAEFLYLYLTGNNDENSTNKGIYAKEVSYEELEIGDIVQIVKDGKASHSMIVTKIILYQGKLVDYLICQHSDDLLNYPLIFKQGKKRYIKILGYY